MMAAVHATPLPRAQFPVTEQYRYLNHAGVAPLPRVAAEAIAACTDDFVHRGGADFPRWEESQERIRQATAGLFGVPTADLAFVKNTTEGLGFVANGLAWQPGDRVITVDREFPSTVYPWLSLRELGVEVELVEPVGPSWSLPLELFEDALERRPTRLVAVSWVQYARGYRIDLAGLAELCHAHGALLCADIIQGVGAIPCELEAWGVDFAMADAHKFLLGPVGIGALYVAARHRDALRPLEPGWASVAHRDDYDHLELAYDDSARRFEGGTFNNLTIEGMGASIALLGAVGVESIWSHVDGMLEHTADALADVGASVVSDRGAGRSANLAFTVPGVEPTEACEALEAQGFVTAPRGGAVRVSPHGYNDADELGALVEAVAALGRAAR